ncbi:MAG: hypothetical protein ACI9X0_001957, partial [Kiritimatiellia bacterium]
FALQAILAGRYGHVQLGFSASGLGICRSPNTARKLVEAENDATSEKDLV